MSGPDILCLWKSIDGCPFSNVLSIAKIQNIALDNTNDVLKLTMNQERHYPGKLAFALVINRTLCE